MQSVTAFNSSAAINSESAHGLDAALDSNHSGVSWSAVIAGAAAAAVMSLLLFILGFGLGLSSLSPWRNEGVDASTLGWASIAWVAFTQIAAAAFGGYLAGRLRVKWSRLHGDEIYFRDTAHGFLAWTIASLVTVAVFGSATAAIASGGAKAGATLATASAAIAAPAAKNALNAVSENGNGENGLIDYYVDNLFHTTAHTTAAATNTTTTNSTATNTATTATNTTAENNAPALSARSTSTARESDVEPTVQSALDASDRAEVVRIFAYSLANDELSAEDKSYLGQMLSQRTGMTAANAETRVSAVYNQARNSIEQAQVKARQAADKARKTAAYTALWMFVALLCGAFVASMAATWGGRQRDSARDILV